MNNQDLAKSILKIAKNILGGEEENRRYLEYKKEAEIASDKATHFEEHEWKKESLEKYPSQMKMKEMIRLFSIAKQAQDKAAKVAGWEAIQDIEGQKEHKEKALVFEEKEKALRIPVKQNYSKSTSYSAVPDSRGRYKKMEQYGN